MNDVIATARKAQLWSGTKVVRSRKTNLQQSYDEDAKILRECYERFTMFCKLSALCLFFVRFTFLICHFHC